MLARNSTTKTIAPTDERNAPTRDSGWRCDYGVTWRGPPEAMEAAKRGIFFMGPDPVWCRMMELSTPDITKRLYVTGMTREDAYVALEADAEVKARTDLQWFVQREAIAVERVHRP